MIILLNKATQFLKDFLWCLIRNTNFGKNLKKDKINLALNRVNFF